MDQAEGDVPILHDCFRMSDSEFDAIVDRLRGLGIACAARRSGRPTCGSM
jgi:hypothetical protein